MPDSLATRRPSAPPTQVGKLPQATTGMTLEDALELAGTSRAEFALIAATTLKEARSLEELASLIATNRRRGLDLLSKQVYFEKFDGSTPSLHVSIDGLRSTAAQTGAYAGSSDPVFRGTWEMPVEGGKKPVPAQCLVVVWRLVQGQKCAFEATAFMSEQYPGPGPRGRMFRQWPQRMLATAAERLALRKGFPVELQGLGDHEPDESTDEPPARTSVTAGMSDADKAQLYDEFFGQTGELPAPAAPPPEDLEPAKREYYADLKQAVDRGAVQARDWKLRQGATRVEIVDQRQQLRAAVNAHTIAQAQRPTTAAQSEPGEVASSPAWRRADRWAERRQLELRAIELGIPVPTLNTRCSDEELSNGNDALRASIKAVEDDLVADPSDREPAGQESLI